MQDSACQFPALHAAAVIDDRQRRVEGVGQETNVARTGVECIGDDLGEDRLFKGAGVGVPQVFEQVLEVDSSLTHGGIISRRSPGNLQGRGVNPKVLGGALQDWSGSVGCTTNSNGRPSRSRTAAK